MLWGMTQQTMSRIQYSPNSECNFIEGINIQLGFLKTQSTNISILITRTSLISLMICAQLFLYSRYILQLICLKNLLHWTIFNYSFSSATYSRIYLIWYAVYVCIHIQRPLRLCIFVCVLQFPFAIVSVIHFDSLVIITFYTLMCRKFKQVSYISFSRGDPFFLGKL